MHLPIPAGANRRKRKPIAAFFRYLTHHVAPNVLKKVKSDVYRHGWSYVYESGLLPPVILSALHQIGISGAAHEVADFAQCGLLGWCDSKERGNSARSKRANPSSTMGDGPTDRKRQGKRHPKPSHYRPVPKGKKRGNRVSSSQPTFKLTNPKQRRAATVAKPSTLWGARASQVQTTAPVSISELKTSVRPKFSMSSDGTKITVSRTEYVDDVKATGTGYQLSTFVLTPTNTTLFPWLSGIASRYESYSFNGVSIHYCPTAPTSVPGMVGMAAEFDAADHDPVDKHQFLNITPADRASVWAGQSIHLTKRDLNILTGENGTRFCGDPLSNEVLKTMTQAGDAHTTLAGRVFLMMQDVVGDIAGEIWVEYSVTLSIPDYSPPCNIPAPLIYSWPTEDSLYYQMFSDDALIQSLTGVTQGINNNILMFNYPSKYYRVTINVAGPAGTFLSNAHANIIGLVPSGGVVVEYGIIGSGHFLTNNTAVSSTHGVASVYVSTAALSAGGPSPADPGELVFNLNNVLVGTATLKRLSTRVQELTPTEWEHRTVQPFGEAKEGKETHPDDDWDEVSNRGSATPEETSGWIRASRVLGYAQAAPSPKEATKR